MLNFLFDVDFIVDWSIRSVWEIPKTHIPHVIRQLQILSPGLSSNLRAKMDQIFPKLLVKSMNLKLET